MRAVLIADEFEGSIWNVKDWDNESRGSVAVSATVLFIQSSDKTNQLSKNFYLSLLKEKNA